jgi:serine/threonine-protein kinase RsbW
MAEQAILREVTLTLPLAPDMEIAAGKTATAMAELMSMGADRIDEVRMAVVEACINAIEHSHSPDQKVQLTFEVLGVLGGSEPESLRITVRDAGVGFAPNDVEVPTMKEKLKATRKRGWGLKIIKGLMDDVQIRSGTHGTMIVMTKSRG